MALCTFLGENVSLHVAFVCCRLGNKEVITLWFICWPLPAFFQPVCTLYILWDSSHVVPASWETTQHRALAQPLKNCERKITQHDCVSATRAGFGKDIWYMLMCWIFKNPRNLGSACYKIFLDVASELCIVHCGGIWRIRKEKFWLNLTFELLWHYLSTFGA